MADMINSYEDNEEREAQGWVPCTYPDCRARINPSTLAEYVEAYEHWKSHPYLCGCSHGN